MDDQEKFYHAALSNDAANYIRGRLAKIHKRPVTQGEVDQVRQVVIGYSRNQSYQFYQAHRGNLQSALNSITDRFTPKRSEALIEGDSEFREYQLDEAYTGQRKAGVVRDVQQIHSTDVHINKLFGYADMSEFLHKFMPHAHIHTYPTMFANTRNQQLDWYNGAATSAAANSHRTFSWAIMPIANWTQGTINAQGGELRNILSIECGSIIIPNEFSEHFNEFRRVSMLIHELAANSMAINDKVRAHFVFDCETIPSDTGSTRVKLTNAMPSREKYMFHVPVSHLSNITISFASPYEQILWPADRDMGPVIGLANNLGNLEVTTTYSAGHGLSNGDLVYILGVAGANGDTALIAEIEDSRGHVISNASGATFEIAGIDISSSMITHCTTIIFGSRIFDIPLVVEYEN